MRLLLAESRIQDVDLTIDGYSPKATAGETASISALTRILGDSYQAQSVKILNLRFLIFVVTILAIGLGLGHWFASELAASNPDGMWIYTPPADHIGPAPPAYPIGYSLVVFAIGIITLVLSATFWIVTKFWLPSMRQLATQLLVTSVACCVLFFVANSIVEFHYSKRAQCDPTDVSNDCEWPQVKIEMVD